MKLSRPVVLFSRLASSAPEKFLSVRIGVLAVCFALCPIIIPSGASARIVCDQQPGQPRSCGYVPDTPPSGYVAPPPQQYVAPQPPANVIIKGGLYYPADGYTWVRDPPVPGDFRVRWVPRRHSETSPHIIASYVEGNWVPEDGYDWVSGVAGDTSVEWMPGSPSREHHHVVASDQEGKFHPEEGYKWVDPDSHTLEAIDNGLVDEAIRGAKIKYEFDDLKRRLNEFYGLTNYDRVQDALRILATGWIVPMPLAASPAQRNILLDHAQTELKRQLKAALKTIVDLMIEDMERVTPYSWNPFGEKQREAIKQMEIDITNLQSDASHQIEETDSNIFREIRSGSQQAALQYYSSHALWQLEEINRKRNWVSQ